MHERMLRDSVPAIPLRQIAKTSLGNGTKVRSVKESNKDVKIKKGEKRMKIVYRDNLGIVAMEVNRDGIDFCDGLAYFTADWGEEFKIPLGAIVRIICA